MLYYICNENKMVNESVSYYTGKIGGLFMSNKAIFDTYKADLIEYEDFLATIRYHRTFVYRKDVIKHYINVIINTKEKIAELKRNCN